MGKYHAVKTCMKLDEQLLNQDNLTNDFEEVISEDDEDSFEERDELREADLANKSSGAA